MDFNPNKQTALLPKAGRLLIAEPFLSDPNFARSVILICEHGSGGTVGFTLNKPTEHSLGDLLPELYSPLVTVFHGGPVQVDTLHMLHRTPLLFGGNEVVDGVYWGGSYEALKEAVTTDSFQSIDLRLFVGYSGWEPGQLQQELKDGSWIVAEVPGELLFDTETKELWRSAIDSLGRDFAYLKNMPINPQLN